MTLCTESGAEQAHYEQPLPDTLSPGQDRDYCPITTAFPSVLPEHRVNSLPGDNHQQASQSSSVRNVSPSMLKLGHAAIPVSNSDPPFERLWTLRI